MNEHSEQGALPHAESNPEVRFEKRDLSVRGVLTFLIVLAVAGVVITAGLWGVYKYLAGSSLRPTPTANPIATSNRQLKAVGGDPAVMFPNPRLQPDPTADLNKFRAREEEVLNSYGWVDQAGGTVHIPIEQAIAVVAQSGLPARGNVIVPRVGVGISSGGVVAAK